MQHIATSAAERKGCLQEPEAGANVGLPPGLVPERFPIIAKHFFGIEPASISRVSAAARYLPPLLSYEGRQ